MTKQDDARARVARAVWTAEERVDLRWDYPAWNERTGEIGQRLACRALGHLATLDHCGMPEHDHCAYCQRPMPGAARRRQ